MLQFLLQHLNARGRTEDVDFTPAVHSAVHFKAGTVDVLRVLHDNNVDLNALVVSGTTALIEGVKSGNNLALEFLLENTNVSIDRVDNLGLTALMHACREGQDASVALLLQHGADLNLRTLGGKTALFFAVRNNARSVRHLLAHNATVNLVDHIGLSPLLDCARQTTCRVDILQMLLDNGANVNYQSNLKSALYYALSGKHFEAVIVLLRAGIRTDVILIDEILICDVISFIVNVKQESVMAEKCALGLFACGGDTFKKMKPYLEHFDLSESNPIPSLRHSSRFAVRKAVLSLERKPNLLYQVTKLPVPRAIRRYLIYDFDFGGL